MPLTKEQKKDIVGKLAERLGKARILIFANFHGLSVKKTSELRKQLKNVESEYIVAKKTLLGVAAKDVGLELGRERLDGEIGVAFCGSAEDANLATAKEIATFSRKNKDILKIIGGFWGKNWIDIEEIKKLAAIPPREVLLTQLVFMLTQPMASLARVLNEVSKKLESK